jgi:energy-coupling factor transport system permease protein
MSRGNVLLHWKFIKITDEGVHTSVFMVIRIVLLIMGSSLLTYTTSPITLTDAIERLLSPLRKIKFPVHELAMMMSIALRFIPTLIEETDKIMSAQKARGAEIDTGSFTTRAKNLISILVPLFISAFRRADELATAMECRCYHGGEGRTRLRQLKSAPRDYIALGVTILFLAGVIVLGRLF